MRWFEISEPGFQCNGADTGPNNCRQGSNSLISLITYFIQLHGGVLSCQVVVYIITGVYNCLFHRLLF